MRQFMIGDTILILGHMYNRILSYRSALLTSRNRINGSPIGDKLAEFKASDFRGKGSEATDILLKAVETSCRALGHTPEADKHARQNYWAMNDHFGLNSVYATITPDDLCSVRVRLYANPEKAVSFTFYSSNKNISTSCKNIYKSQISPHIHIHHSTPCLISICQKMIVFLRSNSGKRLD